MGTGALPIPEALRTRLRAEPTDRESWLVFADWLADRGDPRGQLITLDDRIEHEKLSKKRHYALRIERDELLQAHRETWLQGWVPPNDAVLDWRGGFVVGVTLYGHRAVQDFETLLGRPAGQLLASVRFEWLGGDREYAALAHCRVPAGISALTITGFPPEESPEALFHAPFLASVRSLRLPRTLGTHTEALAAAPLLGRLHTLDLSENPLGASEMTRLARARWAPTTLDLSRTRLGEEGARALAEAPFLASMRSLRLGGNQLRAGGVAHLVEKGALRALHLLDLSANELGDSGVERLLDAGPWPELTSLNLSYNGIGDAGIRRLARSNAMGALEHLHLVSNPLSSDGIEALARAEGLSALEELDLRFVPQTDEDIDLLRRSERLAGCRIRR